MAGKKSARSRRRSALLGTGLIVAFVVAVYVAITANSGLPGVSGTTVRAAFDDVGALRAGDDVRIANVRVGQVKDIQLVDGKPLVTMGLDGDRKIYRDAGATAASIGARSALGQKYVDLQPGNPAAGQLPADSVIPAGKTVGSQELADVLRVLDAPTRQALGSTLREAGGGLGGHSQDLKDAASALPQELPDLGVVSRALSARDGADLAGLLKTADSLSVSFQGHQQQLAQLTQRLGTTLQSLNVDRGKPLADSLSKAPSTLADVKGALGGLNGPLGQTEQAVRTLRPGAEALGQATPDVRGVLREGVPSLDKVPGVAAQADPAVTDLTHVMTDAKPLAPRLTAAIGAAKDPVGVLAPYAPEVSMFFSYAADALHLGDAAGHWLRFYPVLNLESADGTLPIADPTVARDAYPAPGQAAKEKKNGLLGGRK
ncbi:MlaD family protein [Amycolatopsis circi]|uniref:MlaD family protein n=1 Tax=Amycolatopsis circi TaxID=871959 RepID=UPI000E26EC34|nr:MlaD family protein [Amycolatopsis circi]